MTVTPGAAAGRSEEHATDGRVPLDRIGGQSLRVSVVTETYPPEINGVANTMRHLVEGLGRNGHRVQLIRPRQGDEHDAHGAPDHAEVLVPGLPIPGYRGLRFGLPVYWRLRRAWRASRPDVIYVATEGPLGRAALGTAGGLGIPVVTGFHTQFHKYSKHYGLGLLRKWIADSLRRFHNRSDATLVPTTALGDELASMGFHNVYRLGRGVDTELFHPGRRRPDLRAAWGCDEDGPVVLHVGRLASEKNLDLVLDAFDGIAARLADARLVLVGDGPELARLRQMQPKVVLAGAKVGVELAEHYASGDLFLFPSLTETFGNVVPEAMASGLPVIAFDYAAAADCIRNGEDGIRVPLGERNAFVEAAVSSAGNATVRAEMGRRARAAAERMSWSRVVADLEARFLDVIRRRREHADETLAATSR